MAKEKKIPLRMCLACREMKPKREMLRVVKAQDGRVFIDTTGKAAGRGAYVCRQKACMDKLCKHRLLNRNYSCEIPAEVYEALKREFEAYSEGVKD